MKVRLVQLLCPARHCVMGVAYKSENGKADPKASVSLTTTFSLAVAAGILNPWCGLCKSRELHTEDGATAFTSMEEANTQLREIEREQDQTRRFLEASKG